ncbi:aminotransferase class V-fold PLP-dependent enzyme [Agromyces sp. LHK192]|uniref:aminotransferase class V-fold PLP-dependent enzyme n=1 Tax=Agromyces sp. LHK192 TaxID=2498704 RepID=UPI000FDB7284|nr:aminotransferase class V-fold PLP-dependent enzyme [Agromyces sp. LHK192]
MSIAVAAPSTARETMRPLALLADAGLEVPVLGGGRVAHTNLDLAASAPALATVARTVGDLLPWYSSVHRGTGFPSEVVTELVEDARAVVSRHVGARDRDVVVFTRNTTDALNLLATAVPGDVVVLDIEHHANLLPWRSRRLVVAADTIEETLERLAVELASKPAALVAVTGASNVTGELLPVARFAALAHAYGARIAVDAAQLLPHRAVDLGELDADYLVCSGHKTYAPYGAGALIGRADWLDVAPAYLSGGGAVSNVELERVAWHPSPERHEAGTPNVLGIVSFAAALQELERLGPDARVAHEAALTERLERGAASIDGVRVIHGFTDAPGRVGIVTVQLERGSVGLVAAALSAEHGVSVRAGRFCAHPFFDRVATRANGLRASLGLGSSSDDVDRFVAALSSIVADGPTSTYQRTGDGWKPVADDRPKPQIFRAG